MKNWENENKIKKERKIPHSSNNINWIKIIGISDVNFT
jgi:hypothetical protein